MCFLQYFDVAISFTPCLPSAVIATEAANAFNAWFEQILDVALSRRICCSRACSVNTNPRLHLHLLFVRQDVLELYALIFSLLQSNHSAVHQMRWDTKWLCITDYNISTKFSWRC